MHSVLFQTFLNCCGHRGQNEVAQYCSSNERKELSAQNPISSENIIQEWRRNQVVIRWRNTKRICHQQTYPKIMAKGRSLNRKETMKEETLSGKKQKTLSKNMHKHNIFSFSWILWIMFDGRSKYCNIVWCDSKCM